MCVQVFFIFFHFGWLFCFTFCATVRTLHRCIRVWCVLFTFHQFRTTKCANCKRYLARCVCVGVQVLIRRVQLRLFFCSCSSSLCCGCCLYCFNVFFYFFCPLKVRFSCAATDFTLHLVIIIVCLI